MAKRSLFTQDARRPDVLPGLEPLYLPPIRDAAMDEPLAGHDDGRIWFPLRAHLDVVESGQGLDRLHFALPIPAATRPRRGGRRIFYRRKCTGGNASRQSRAARRLRL